MAIKGYKQKVEPPPKIHELKALIDKWREPSLVKVDSRLVVPDTSNRGHSGLSVDHVHLLATMMMKDGFRSRNPEFKKKGHDGKPMQVNPTHHKSTVFIVEFLTSNFPSPGARYSCFSTRLTEFGNLSRVLVLLALGSRRERRQNQHDSILNNLRPPCDGGNDPDM